jgi:CheY-like chemotaxis protein
MPPEQITNAQKSTQAADVFSMGATLYALLAGGRAPFARANYAEALLATVKESCRPLSEIRRDLTPATVAMIDRCLSKSPADRYPDAAALLHEIRFCRAALPIAAQAPQVPPRALEPQPRISTEAPLAAGITGRKAVILSVEDNETEQLILEHLIKKLPWESDFFQTASAEEALNLIQRVTPDVILTDICMADMDGYEFIEKIRALPGHALTPIVVKSAISEDVGKQKSLHLGADAYLQKPVRFDVLEKTLARMLARRKASSSAPNTLQP